MKTVAFTGCRDRTISYGVLNSLEGKFIYPGEQLLVGDCPTGVDWCVKTWALDKDLPINVEYADWDKYSRAAGPIRNERMVKKADLLIAFWDGRSSGTKSAINFAIKHKVDYYVFFL